MNFIVDRFGRIVRTVRISVTDRCNLNCLYCSHSKTVTYIPKKMIMSFEEITYIVEILAELGINKVRITGGEPLVRRDISYLIKRLGSVHGLSDIALTTNGTLLSPSHVQSLYDAGLSRINISIDSLDPETYHTITGGGELHRVLSGIQNAKHAGFSPIKLNTVLIKGVNDREIMDLFNYAKKNDLALRFIEEMPFGANSTFIGISNDFVIKQLKDHIYFSSPLEKKRFYSGPAVTYPIRGSKGSVGFISPLSHPFCAWCDRIRISTCGRLLPCISRENGVDLLPLIRNGAGKEKIISMIKKAIYQKEFSHNGFVESIQMNRVGG